MTEFEKSDVVMLTMFDADEYVKFLYQMTRYRIFVKNRLPEELIASIYRAEKGSIILIDPIVSKTLIKDDNYFAASKYDEYFRTNGTQRYQYAPQ